MKLEDKRIAMLVGPGFEDLEFWAVYMRMKEEGAQIDVVGMANSSQPIVLAAVSVPTPSQQVMSLSSVV